MYDMGACPLFVPVCQVNVSAGPGNKKTAAAPTIVGFAGGSAGIAEFRSSPVALRHRLSAALL
jgi:hypothetical protein